MTYAESNYEEAILEFFEELGYNRVFGYDIDHDYYNPLYMDELESALQRVNPTLPPIAIGEAIDKEAAEHSNNFVTDEKANREAPTTSYNFNALMDEFQSIVGQLMQTNSPTMAQKITKIVESHLGAGKKPKYCPKL